MRVWHLLVLAAAAAQAQAAPRLLMSFPRNNGVYGFRAPGQSIGPLSFLFSEPMDPAGVVLPNLQNSNPDRSLDAFLSATAEPIPLGSLPLDMVGPARTREDGRLMEIVASFVATDLTQMALLHLYRNGFHNLSGQPLAQDYAVSYSQLQSAEFTPDDALRISIPAESQPGADPSAPFSIYPGTALDAVSFQEQLTLGPNGTPITPLVFHWDTPGKSVPAIVQPKQGFLHLTVDHPLLMPSPRPYTFTAPNAFPVTGLGGGTHVFFTVPLRFQFTVGPALAGDLNGDGQVTVADVVLALRAALGFLTLTATQTFAADLVPRNGANGHPIGDGNVTVADATYILQRAIGLVPDDQWP